MANQGKTFVGFGFGPIQSGLFVFEALRSGNFQNLVIAEVDAELIRRVLQQLCGRVPVVVPPTAPCVELPRRSIERVRERDASELATRRESAALARVGVQHLVIDHGGRAPGRFAG